jgi:hypothetical protein
MKFLKPCKNRESMKELYTYCMDASSSRIHNNLKYSREFYNKHAQVPEVTILISIYAEKTCIQNDEYYAHIVNEVSEQPLRISGERH